MRLGALASGAAPLVLTLAIGCTESVTPPPPLPQPATIADVSLGTAHSCAVMSTGEMSCWGFNTSGQLGRGVPASNSTSPVVVPMDRPFAAVAAGTGHTCALDAAGIGFCWGSTTGGRDPLAPSSTLRFRQLAAGSGYTCGLDVASAAWCWSGTSQPVAVAGGMTFKAIEAGSQATCALTEAGAAYCWGGNALGSLGDGTTTPSSTPVAVTGGHVFTDIDLGSGHACGLKADGAAWCWGDATHGQMGDGRAPSTAARSVAVGQPTPVRVASSVPFIGIAVGERFACGVALTGTWCWGYNSGGQLGDGSTVHRGSPVLVGGGRTFTDIYAGGYHACGIGNEGTSLRLFCWGDNMFGQLGVGTTAVHRTPVRVALPGED